MVSVEQIGWLVDIPELSDRLEVVARLTPGNIVEIGGGEGINTLRFLKIAGSRSETVIVIDPFDYIPGSDKSYFEPYTMADFLKTINNHPELSKNMLLIDLPSQHPDIAIELKSWQPIGFMFIDGLQDKESVMSDIRLAVSLDVEVICIDDYDRLTESSQVPLAVDWFKQRLIQYEFVYNGQREIYLVKT